MNNKGQTLVLFILLIPLMLMMFGFVIDMGNLYVAKRKLHSTVTDALEYSQKLPTESLEQNIKKHLNLNLENNEVQIEIDTSEIKITVTSEVQSLFSFIIGKKSYKISDKQRIGK